MSRVLEERDLQHSLQVRTCSHRDGQRLDPAVRRTCLRRPQRPGNRNAHAHSRNPPAIHPRELPEPLVYRDVPADAQDIQRFAGSTLRQQKLKRNRNPMLACAEVVEGSKFLWNVLEKPEISSPAEAQRPRKIPHCPHIYWPRAMVSGFLTICSTRARILSNCWGA